MYKKIFVILVVFSSFIAFNKIIFEKDKTKYVDNTTNTDLISIYLEESSGTYVLSNSKIFPTSGYVLNTNKSSCTNGGVINLEKISLSSSDSCQLYFNNISFMIGSEITLALLGLTAKSGEPDFSSVATTDETADGLYAMADDYGTSYYFRGNVTNNYVNFAGFYWRIIRINGDGSIRMIYDGTQAYTNGTSNTARYVTTKAFNSSYNNNAYVGYMYGSTSGSTYEEVHANTNSSTIKTYLEDTWYKTNIEDKGYSKYLSDEIFCNDRSLDTSNSSYTGIGTTTTYYGAYQRLVRNTTKTPQLTCPQKNDSFTVSDTTNGNGALKYPVGLITADEIVLAGGKSGTNNSSYYLYKGNWYWSLSPYDFSGSSAVVFNVSDTGNLKYYFVNNTLGVAPVINLSAEYSQQLRGSGTASSPFTLRPDSN